MGLVLVEVLVEALAEALAEASVLALGLVETHDSSSC
jgi:hypothetical protein